MNWDTLTPDLIALAKRTLTADEFSVWLTKYVAGKGRRSGSLTLGITEDAWRYRLHQADRKMNIATKEAA